MSTSWPFFVDPIYLLIGSENCFWCWSVKFTKPIYLLASFFKEATVLLSALFNSCLFVNCFIDKAVPLNTTDSYVNFGFDLLKQELKRLAFQSLQIPKLDAILT